MNKINTVLWDIDGTILNFLESEKCAVRKCFSVFGLGECTDEMIKEYSAINVKYWGMLEKGVITREQVLEFRFNEFFSNHGIDTSVVTAFNKEYQVRLGDTICFQKNALETLNKLKGKIKQYAVTNGTKIAQNKKLTRSGLIDIFDGVFISELVGAEKPTPEFFDKVFESIGYSDRSSVMIVGDRLTSDIQGGNNAGILTCWYNPDGEINTDGLKIDYEIKDLYELCSIIL